MMGAFASAAADAFGQACGRKQGDSSQTRPMPNNRVSPKPCKAGVADKDNRPKASNVLAAPRQTASQLAPSPSCSSRKMP